MERLEAYFDGRLDDAGRAELEAWLASGPEARAAFWAEAERHALLREAAQEAQGRARAVAELRPRRRRRTPSARRSTLPLWIAAACAVAALGLALALRPRPLTKAPVTIVGQPARAPAPTPPAPPPPIERPKDFPAPPPAAPKAPEPAPVPEPPKPAPKTTVAALGTVERVTGSAGVREGAPILAGAAIGTDDGRVELALADGTRVRLEEDTAVVVESGTRLRLDRGGIEAVIPSGRDRTFASPGAEARVLGTVLRLNAEGAETALHVDEGRVRFTRLSDGASVEVPAGHLAVAKPAGPLVATAATAVVALQVVDHKTGKVLETLRDGMTLRLKGRPAVALIAETAGPAPGCVVFDYDAQRAFNTERAGPFGLMNGGVPWTPAPGAHTVTATPYSGPPAAGKRGGTGVAGRALTVRFNVE